MKNFFKVFLLFGPLMSLSFLSARGRLGESSRSDDVSDLLNLSIGYFALYFLGLTLVCVIYLRVRYGPERNGGGREEPITLFGSKGIFSGNVTDYGGGGGGD